MDPQVLSLLLLSPILAIYALKYPTSSDLA